ncbi:hypothetical protein HCJ52_06395 [Listeria sp. FSL L7-1485]|uniref:Uncharacterized protein n=1 Tax=Listeria immobilis TaxID=2713502 RepID=A0A7X0X762_9LIST|nr:hypothetical protein [Listeria immobilis]MBC1488722.1 hypothetical protein [Listeria immobilis]MBC1535755.1 hypothetical protein [Listeria immobilis]
METTNISKLVKENKLVPLYAFNNNSARKIYIFYRKDVQAYNEKLEAYRDLRKKVLTYSFVNVITLLRYSI